MSDLQVGYVVLGIVLLGVILFGRSFSGKLGAMSVTLGTVDKNTNHRTSSQPTLSEEMSLVAADVKAHRVRFEDVVSNGLTPRVAAMESSLLAISPRVAVIELTLTALTNRVGHLEHPVEPPHITADVTITAATQTPEIAP